MINATAFAALAAAATAAGATASVGDGTRLLIDGEDLSFCIEIRELRDRSSHRFASRSFDPKRYRVTISNYRPGYRDRMVVPCRKGVYQWAEAVPMLQRMARERKAERQRQTQTSDNKPLAEAIREELGLDSYGLVRIQASTSPTSPLVVEFNRKILATPAQVRLVVAALREAGISLG